MSWWVKIEVNHYCLIVILNNVLIVLIDKLWNLFLIIEIFYFSSADVGIDELSDHLQTGGVLQQSWVLHSGEVDEAPWCFSSGWSPPSVKLFNSLIIIIIIIIVVVAIILILKIYFIL